VSGGGGGGGHIERSATQVSLSGQRHGSSSRQQRFLSTQTGLGSAQKNPFPQSPIGPTVQPTGVGVGGGGIGVGVGVGGAVVGVGVGGAVVGVGVGGAVVGVGVGSHDPRFFICLLLG